MIEGKVEEKQLTLFISSSVKLMAIYSLHKSDYTCSRRFWYLLPFDSQIWKYIRMSDHSCFIQLEN